MYLAKELESFRVMKERKCESSLGHVCLSDQILVKVGE